MHADVTFNLSTVYGFLLVLARVSGVILFVPLPGFSAGPDTSRIVLALALTMTLSPVWPAPVLDGPVLGRLLGWIGAEAAFGLTIGVAVAFLLEGVQMGAQVIGLQAETTLGEVLGRVVDIIAGKSSTQSCRYGTADWTQRTDISQWNGGTGV